MQTITTIGFDIAKSVFQVHGAKRTFAKHRRLLIATGLNRSRDRVLCAGG